MIDGRSVLALITARGGSKGLPRKNVLPIAGKPLIAWTIEAARQSPSVDRCIVSTDDDEIARVSQEHGAEIPFRRAAELARDEASSMDVVADALRRVPGFDILLLLQPTSPLRSAADIERGLRLLIDSNADSCVSVAPAIDHPWLTFRIGRDARLEPFCEGRTNTRRQDMPAACVLNGAFYAAPVASLVTLGSFTAGRVAAFEMPRADSADIDEFEDFQIAERLLLQRLAS
jgi:CMP-N,N'-diacetyllegionaminic acid synthase